MLRGHVHTRSKRFSQILEEHRRLSKSAYEHSLAFLSQRAVEPPGGPLPRVAPLPLGNTTELKGMYHVVVTADGGVYGRWQTLVRPRNAEVQVWRKCGASGAQGRCCAPVQTPPPEST